jgi:peptidoglycan hydrolase-like protein with peptidoglycan-binding domain
MTDITRYHRSMRSAVRGLCVATIAGLTLATVPTVAVASPAAVQSPSLPQTVVGLRQGATGADVVALQKALMAAGVTVPGGADGFFGPATKSALTAFQSRSGLATTGEVDQPSASALGLSAVTNAPQASSGLTVGSQGDAVKELQNALMAAGVFVPGGADGVFGPATKRAVSNFQRWNSLAVTGEVDASTASRLKLGSAAAAATPAATPAAVAAPAASTTSSTTFVGMKVGARGESVKVLQRALIAAGITVRGGADGVFGPMTAAALTSYQQANGLPANGVVDEALVTKLALVAGAPAPLLPHLHLRRPPEPPTSG